MNLPGKLKNPANEFKPVAFWFLNHYIEEEESRRQIREMAEKGFGGIMLHARDGLLGGYLDSHWEKFVGWAIDEAEKLGIYVYLYDELNYPSGPAGGKVFEKYPDSAMGYLVLSTECNVKPGDGFNPDKTDGDYVLFLAVDHSGDVERVSRKWKNTTGKTVQILGFTLYFYRPYPDVLNAEHSKEFVRLSYTWYAERFKKHFGKTILAEFTDNSCANFGYVRRSIPWTPALSGLFKKHTGRDFEKILPSLFIETPEFNLHRIIFWRFINERYLDTFIRPIEAECAKNGIAATGHYCIEEAATEHVRQLGNRFDQKRHQHIPGVDMLGDKNFISLAELVRGKPHPLSIPMTSSAAYFVHGSRVLCESFGLSAGWAMTLAEMRRLGGFIMALGGDLIVPHGIYYSIAGHRKRECVPDYLHNPMWEFFDRWAVWTGRICSLTAFSHHIAESAIFYPVTSQQASIELKDPSFKKHGAKCDRIDMSSQTAAESLLENNIQYEMIDESLIADAEISYGELFISLPDGYKHAIRTLVMPSAWIVNEPTLVKLRKFAASGGRIIALNDKISAVFDGEKIKRVKTDSLYFRQYVFHDRSSLEETDFTKIVGDNRRRNFVSLRNTQGKIILREWEKNGQHYALLHNYTRDRLSGVEIKCAFEKGVSMIDLDDISMSGITTGRDGSFTHDFDYGETLLLADCKTQPENKKTKIHTPPLRIEGPWKVVPESPNALRITDFKCVFKNKRHWIYEFEIVDIPEKTGIALDLDPSYAELRNGIHPFKTRLYNCKYFSRVECNVNGNFLKTVSFGKDFDHWIYQDDITQFVKKGYNTVELIQPDSDIDANAIPDPVMITGNFGIAENKIVKSPTMLDSPRWDNTVLADYSGAMSFRKTIVLPDIFRGRNLLLSLGNVREIAQVFVDGKLCGTRIMPPYDVAIPVRKTDKFELELRLLNTPFNRWNIPCVSGIENQEITIRSK